MGGNPCSFFTQWLTVIFVGWMIRLCTMSGAKAMALPTVPRVGGAILLMQVHQAFRIENNVLHFLWSFLLHNNLEVTTLRELMDVVGVEEEVDWDKGQAPLVVYKHLLKYVSCHYQIWQIRHSKILPGLLIYYFCLVIWILLSTYIFYNFL